MEKKLSAENNNFEELRALIGRRNRHGMAAGWNQFWLLFRKNLLLAKRSKLWVFFELLLPCIFTLPIILIVTKYANIENYQARSFEAVTVTGTGEDLLRSVHFTKSPKMRWNIPGSTVNIAYNTDIGGPDLTRIINDFSARYANYEVELDLVQFPNRSAMIAALKDDIANITDSINFIGKYAAGIEFTELDIKSRKLGYNIHVPNLPSTEGDIFKIGTNWIDVYGPTQDYNRDECDPHFLEQATFLDPEMKKYLIKENEKEPIDEEVCFQEELEGYEKAYCHARIGCGKSMPPSPPYWSSAFISFQYALDSIFIKQIGGSELSQAQLHRLPEYPYSVNSIASFIKFLPILWGMCAFLTVLHSGREVAHEKATVKAFLSVMGLSSPMFYWSHVLFSWLKCLIIFTVCAVPLSTVMPNMSTSLFFATFFLYGLGAVVFGVLIASIFASPNNVIKVTLMGWMFLIALPYVKTPRSEEVGLCFLSSLNINGAFYQAVEAISDNMYNENPLGWMNMFEGGALNFTIGYALVMMAVDIIWMSLLTLLFDLFLGGTDFSFRGIFAREGVEEADNHEHKPLVEQEDAALRQSKPDIEVRDLVKIWSETGERAVDGFFLNAYPGQVTVLLGHNGAGKSTTFSILCGIIKSTAGSVKVCDEDVSVGQTHHNVGYCPQGNALFDKLTVDEHLWLINGLKNGTVDWKLEGAQLKDRLGLMEKSYELSMNLSGGMKRKLCVCLALIGKSKVVLLDEPTAGMDPGARRHVEQLLVEEKRNRTILLTTHYMDEAELLGDRVAIMTRGRVSAVGTPEFLKAQFGTGYILTVVIEDDVKVTEAANKIAEFAVEHIEGARQGEVHGRQLEIILPRQEQKNFPRFFQALEKNQVQLKIASFGLSLNTLEQVFLKVGEEANRVEDLHYIDSESDLNKRLIESQKDPINMGVALILAQLHAIFTKRILYTIRNWPQLVTQVVIPMLILVFITWMTDFAVSSGGSDYSRNFTRNEFGPSRVALQVNQNTPVSNKYKQLINTWPDSVLVEFKPSDNFTARVNELPKTMPATGLGASFGEDKVEAYFNNRAVHSVINSMNLISNARVLAIGEGTIMTGIYSFSKPASTSKLLPSGLIDYMVGPLMMVALALVTSTFVMFYVDERKSKFAHQQSLTGVSPLVFWGGSLIYDFVFYTIVCACFLIFFLVSGWLSNVIGFVILLWFLYFWAVMPFIYTVSFMFSSPSKANILLIIWQIIAATAAIITVYILSILPNVDKTVVEIVRSCLLTFLPSFALGNGLMTLGMFAVLPIPGAEKELWHWDNLGKNITFMMVFALLSSLVFIAFQFKIVRRAFSRIWDIRNSLGRNNSIGEQPVDEDVAKEQTTVRQQSQSGSLLLEVNTMSKSFGKVRAVDDLSMGINEGECFGLLGVNGAGKTTTFDILTGQSFPTKGFARIDNHDVTEHIAIGYCPQFDAMMMDFTGKETLVMIARMYGFKDPERKADLVLDAVGMSQHGHKLVRYYSGGQRRKISVGLALLACTKIVILDEPTAGIDPKARRDVWNVLTAVRNNSKSALLLTSHSMDECEALCTRIAMLNRGRMIAIGPPQHVKSKFGNKFALTMVVPTPEEKPNVIEQVALRFKTSTLKTHSSDNTLTLRWEIPRVAGDLWSCMFAECQKLADSLGIKDFCLTQSSLEETFLQLSSDGNTSTSSSSSP